MNSRGTRCRLVKYTVEGGVEGSVDSRYEVTGGSGLCGIVKRRKGKQEGV